VPFRLSADISRSSGRSFPQSGMSRTAMMSAIRE